MKNILDIFKISTQKKVSLCWEGIKELLGRVMFYIGIISLVIITITAYHTSIGDIIPISFWVFFLTLNIILFIVMVFEYVIILPSSISFPDRQSYKYDSPTKEDMNKILKKLENIEQRLKLSEELSDQRLRLLERQQKLYEEKIKELHNNK